MDRTPEAPVGVFDSGLGGLTVVAALQRALPDERILYLGDTARVPYGTKSVGTVVRYSLQIAAYLTQRGIKYLVAACNTASAHAIDALRAQLPIPVSGVVEPGAELAARRSASGRIGVLGTIGTIGSGAYRRAIERLRPDAEVHGQACPLFVPLADEGWSDHPVTHEVARHYLGELRQRCDAIDTLVLGCTHYPLLSKTIGAAAAQVFGRPLTLIDSANAVADAVGRDLRARGLCAAGGGPGPEHHFVVTDDSRFGELAPRFLGHPVSCEHADL